MGLGLYKCSSMGILPTGSSDWLQFETRSDVSRPRVASLIEQPPEWSAARAASLG